MRVRKQVGKKKNEKEARRGINWKSCHAAQPEPDNSKTVSIARTVRVIEQRIVFTESLLPVR